MEYKKKCGKDDFLSMDEYLNVEDEYDDNDYNWANWEDKEKFNNFPEDVNDD